MNPLESGMGTRDVPVADWVTEAGAARDAGYDYFDWLSAVDQSDAETDPGLDLVCHLIATGEGSPRPLARLLLRTRLPDAATVASLTTVYAGAAWHERETHEMFGVEFTGFDDGTDLGLRPLLLPDGFEGTPLRKSFVLAARASKAWPGAKEPGESDRDLKPAADGEAAPARKPARRRRLLPPGVPDESWGPR
ncbi:MAG: NADH-quinone oxidoreductase subunit C [Ornithinimicrobium sp.]|uniref:NADH-quinone oxidoreductase subunit C n=1 Tax=Ornithinimicrobium sp. TaxID=1977084 RepID=UPI003D9B6816